MSDSRSLFGDCHEMAHIWTKIQVVDQVFKIRTVQTYVKVLRKRFTLSAASIFVAECLFVYIHLFPVI